MPQKGRFERKKGKKGLRKDEEKEKKFMISAIKIGGGMLFRLRFGFSGTPNSLLPVEMRKCEYENGTDGKVIRYLSSPNIVQIRMVNSGWNVTSLLQMVANSDDPPYNALIDTGALITGLSNMEVSRFLLKVLEWRGCERSDKLKKELREGTWRRESGLKRRSSSIL